MNERIDDILKIYKSRHDAKAFAKLGTVLNQDRYGLGQSIVSEHKFFIIFIQWENETTHDWLCLK